MKLEWSGACSPLMVWASYRYLSQLCCVIGICRLGCVSVGAYCSVVVGGMGGVLLGSSLAILVTSSCVGSSGQ